MPFTREAEKVRYSFFVGENMTDEENRALSKRIANGLKEFPKVLARKKRAYEEKKKQMKAFASVSKALQKQVRLAEMSRVPVHPWRLCPLGQYYRTPHKQRSYVRSNGTQVRSSEHPNECVINKTGKDQLYSDEISKIAAKYFPNLTDLPTGGLLPKYPDETEFDSVIAGWTKYWNEVLTPTEPLDQNLVKALIATESGFDPKAWNKIRGTGRARGLMQVKDESVKLLSYRGKELKDHFLNLKDDDMLDPNLAVCAGVRWLFRKREILNSKGKESTWIETVMLYKNYRSLEDKQMQKLIKIYTMLKAGPPEKLGKKSK
jgi:hypothetical protein